MQFRGKYRYYAWHFRKARHFQSGNITEECYESEKFTLFNTIRHEFSSRLPYVQVHIPQVEVQLFDKAHLPKDSDWQICTRREDASHWAHFLR